jgi:hypothetical protein
VDALLPYERVWPASPFPPPRPQKEEKNEFKVLSLLNEEIELKMKESSPQLQQEDSEKQSTK